MAAILPFANALPQTLQVPQMQPQFDKIQQIAQKANSIFETGLNTVKNDYSSVLNTPVTSSRNLQKKEEYIQNFREGLKKITKENLRMPQNVLQAETLLSPFWQDQVMLTDISLTSALQSEMGKYSQAANSSDDKIRATANPASLKYLNWYAEQLRNAGDDINDYTRLGTPKYQPKKNIGADIFAWKESDKGASDIKWEESVYQRDSQGNIVRDANGNAVPLPEGALVKMTNGAETRPAWVHTVSGVMGDQYDDQFKLDATNYIHDVYKQYRDSHPGISDDQVNKEVGKYFVQELQRSTLDMKSTYEIASKDYESQIADLKKAASTQPNGLTKKQQGILTYLEANKKDADNRIIQLGKVYEERTSDSAIASMTEGYLINALSNVYKNQEINKYADIFSHQVKSEIVSNEPLFKMLEHKDRLRGQDIDWQGKKLTAAMQHEGHQVEAMKALMENPNPALEAQFKAMGLIPENFNASVPTTSSSGLSLGFSYAGRGTENVSNIPGEKLAQYSREESVNKIADMAWGAASMNNPQGGLSFQMFLGQVPTEELIVVSKYQHQFQKGQGIKDEHDNISFATPRERELYKRGAEAIYKIAGIPISANFNPSPEDLNNILIDKIGQDVKKYITNGVKPEVVSMLADKMSVIKSEYDRVRADDQIQEKLITEEAKKNRDRFKHSIVRTANGTERLINENDLPITTGLKGIGTDGKNYTFSPTELKKRYLNGEVDIKVYTPMYEPKDRAYGIPLPPSIYSIQVGGIEINPIQGQEASYDKLLQNIRYITGKFGKSSDIGKERSELNAKTYPHKDFYEGLSGATPSVFEMKLKGKELIGKKEVDYDNRGVLSELLLPANNLDIVDEKGKSVKADEETMRLLRQLANSEKLTTYVGEKLPLYMTDKVGVQQLVVPVATLPTNAQGEANPFNKLKGKTFIITKSPDAQGDYINKLPVIPDRDKYHPLLDKNPDVSTISTTNNPVYNSMGIDLRMYYDSDNKGWNITGTSPLGPFYPRFISAVDRKPEQARDIFNATARRMKDVLISNMVDNNIKNGINK